jgi:hypothetical protein
VRKYLDGQYHVKLPTMPGHRLYPSLELVHQWDAVPFVYGRDYWRHYQELKDTPIEKALNTYRLSLVEGSKALIDIGPGNCSFLQSFPGVGYGFDVNEEGVDWLKRNGRFLEPHRASGKVDTWAMFDSLEHFANPSDILDLIPVGAKLAVSLPIFCNLHNLTDSKHYKPDEHRHYMSNRGFQTYMAWQGFDCLVVDDYEVSIGRDSIRSYVFLRKQKYE